MSTYKEVTFDFLADCITKKVKPQETDIAVYYGLEHLDADSIKIQRSGTPDEVIGEKIHALPGDIIFGKRRAYQRKLGVTDCECIASAHSMVLRAKTENVVPEFLPYFMQSDVFMECAVMVSEGSLSPTIKWKTLAKEKFTIPDTDTQRKIAELMMAFDDSIEQRNNISNKLITTKKIKFLNDISNTQKSIMLKDLVDIEYGISLPEQNRSGDGTPVYGSNGIVGYDESEGFDGPSVILGRKGSIDKVTWVEGRFIPIDTTYYLIAKRNTSLKWVYHYLSTVDLRRLNTATGVPSLNRDNLYSLFVPKYSYEEQEKMAFEIGNIDIAIKEIETSIIDLKELKKQILNKIFYNTGGDRQ